LAGRPVAIALAIALASTAHAGGFVVPDLGVRRTAMGAVVGRPDEPAAVYHNPAGLALQPGTHVYVSFGVALPTSSFRLRPWPGSDRFITTPALADGYYPESRPTSAFGVVPMIVATTNVLSDKLWAALSFYVPNAVGGAFGADDVTRYHLLSSYAVAGYGGLSVAWRIGPMLSVGASLGVLYVTAHGTRELFPIFQTAMGKVDLTRALGKDGVLTLDGSAFAPSWNAGVLLEPAPGVSVGVSVIGGNHVSVEGPVTITPSADGFLNPIDGRQSTGLVIPWTLLLGANVDVSRHVEVGAELRWWYYAELQVQHTDVTGIQLLKSLDTPKYYQNSWQLSGGVRVHSIAPRLGGLELMLGLHYDRTPAPDDTVTLDSPTFNHVGLHLGARYTFGARWRVALTYLHNWYIERRSDDGLGSPPLDYVASGQGNLITLAAEVMLGRGLVLRR
jgi:long-chain fatty acid transport protein